MTIKLPTLYLLGDLTLPLCFYPWKMKSWDWRLDISLDLYSTCFDSKQPPPHTQTWTKWRLSVPGPNLLISDLHLDLEVSDSPWARMDQRTSSNSNVGLHHLGCFPHMECFSWGGLHGSHTSEGMPQVVVCPVPWQGCLRECHHHGSHQQGVCRQVGRGRRRHRWICHCIAWLGLWGQRLERGSRPT